MFQHTKTFWKMLYSRLSGNSLGMAPSGFNMHQCPKQGP